VAGQWLHGHSTRGAVRSPRQIAALIVFLALPLASFRFPSLALPFRDRSTAERELSLAADPAPWSPDYPLFLQDVLAHTRPGDSIALVVPTDDWDGGYSYAYYRASYFLPGREVLPVITPENRPVPENVARARYIAAWKRRVTGLARRAVFAQHEGALLER
jgi:hypothetical protein